MCFVLFWDNYIVFAISCAVIEHEYRYVAYRTGGPKAWEERGIPGARATRSYHKTNHRNSPSMIYAIHSIIISYEQPCHHTSE